MQNLYNKFDGNFFNEDYFENGKASGKGWLTNYRWMPQRSFREALAYIDALKLDDKSLVLDIGCAKGFIVKALRELEINADGCDISEYALNFAPVGCWNCTSEKSILDHKDYGYTHIIMKDVLEHFTVEQLDYYLELYKNLASNLMCIVPMGDNGIYRIPEYHIEISHLIAEDENWWINKFKQHNWNIVSYTNHVAGLKDNWQQYANGKGNCVFILNLS